VPVHEDVGGRQVGNDDRPHVLSSCAEQKQKTAVEPPVREVTSVCRQVADDADLLGDEEAEEKADTEIADDADWSSTRKPERKPTPNQLFARMSAPAA